MSSDDFESRNESMIDAMGKDAELRTKTDQWLSHCSRYEYSYHFKWMGRPVIQFPQDLIALQEIIWETKPDLIVETGIARGGSLVFYASLLELIGGDGRVVGIDVDIRDHNRHDIEQHPMYKRITLLEGSSTEDRIVQQVRDIAAGRRRVLVVLDSNHTHAHVLRELQLYSPLVKAGGYLVVLDTFVEDMPEGFVVDRPWARGDNPKTAVWEFLKTTERFAVDEHIQNKLLITVAPDGYLKCLKD